MTFARFPEKCHNRIHRMIPNINTATKCITSEPIVAGKEAL